MIKNTRGNKSYTRPLPIRMLAILLAVVMVLSVLYINNSKGIVEAGTPSNPEITDNDFVNGLIGSTVIEKTCSIYVPSNNVTFGGFTSFNEDDSAEVKVYKRTYLADPEDEESSTTEYYFVKPDEVEGETITAVNAEANCTYAWNNTTIKATSEETPSVLTLTGTYTNFRIPSETEGGSDTDITIVDSSSAQKVFMKLSFYLEPFGDLMISAGRASDENVINRTTSSTESVVYYGEVILTDTKNTEDTNDDEETSMEAINNELSSLKENGRVTKQIKKEIKKGGIVVNSITSNLTFVRNDILLKSNSVTHNDNVTENGSCGNITLTGINPKKAVTIEFETDVKTDDYDVSAKKGEDSVSVSAVNLDDESGNVIGYKNTINIPAYSDMSDVPTDPVVYTITITDGKAEYGSKLEKTFTVSIKYANGKPIISNLQIEQKAIKDGKYYVTSSSGKAAINANVSMPEGDNTPIATWSLATKSGGAYTYGEAKNVSEDNKINDTLSDLVIGENLFKIKAASAFDIESDETEFTVFYDPNPATITPTAKQGTSTADVALDALTCKKDTVISLDPLDGSGESGVESITVTDENGNTVSLGTGNTISIAASDDNNGKTKTYNYTITDVAGNVKTDSFAISFLDEKAEVTYEITNADYDSSEAAHGIIWDEAEVEAGNARSFDITFTIKSKVKLDKAVITDTTGNREVVFTDTDGEYNDTTKEYTYTATYKYNYSVLTDNDKSFKPLLNVYSINGFETPYDKVAILYVDLSNPTATISVDSTSVRKDDRYSDDWYSSLVLLVHVGDVFSGISSVTGTGIKETGNLYSGSEDIVVNVSDSADLTGTDVNFVVKDKAGNTYKTEDDTSYNPKYFVDGTTPTARIDITDGNGTVTQDITGKVWKESISNLRFYASDTPSDVFLNMDKTRVYVGDDTTGISLNDTSLNTKTFAELVGDDPIIQNKEYKVKLVAIDVAGNKVEKSATIIWDDEKPTAEITIPKAPRTPGYFDKSYSEVGVGLKIVDNNLDTKVVKDGDEKFPSWSFDGTKTWTATLKVATEGPHDITLSAKDHSGLTCDANSKWLIIDRTDPVIKAYVDGNEYTESYTHRSSSKVKFTVTDEYKDKTANGIKITVKRTAPTGEKTEQIRNDENEFTISEDGAYEIICDAVDLAGNTSSKTIKFTVDNTKPVHNMYITTADPAKVAKYNNTYSNAVGKFSGHSDQEEYTYGQYYNTDVSIDFSFFDYNIKSAQVTDNGSVLPVNWSFNGPYGKGSYTISSEGYHEIVISSTDKSDNTTTDSGSNQKLRFTIDKSAPTISTSLNGVRYSEGSGVRYFNTNGTIDVSVSDANIDGSDLNRINRMTVPGSSVSVSEASVGEGAETFSTEADYEVQYYAIDRAGNRSDTRTVMFRVDKTAPQLQVSNVGAVSTAGSQNVSFNVKEAFFSDMNNVTIKIYKRVEGRAEVLEKTIDFKPNSANDSTSYTFSEDAEYRIEFTAEDKCGNKSNTDYSFIKDGTAPLITLSGVSNYDKTDKNVELTVIIDEAFYSSNRVTLSGTRTDINDKSNAITFDSFVTNRSKISQLQQLFKEDGIYDITVTSTDKAGNSSSKGVHFTIDTTDPVIGDLSKYDGIRTNSFKWDTNLDDLVTDLTVCDIKVYMDGSLYDGTSDVEDGSHVLKIEATDELGHTTTKEVTFVIDSRGPNIIISNVEDGDNLLESTEVIVTVELDEDSLDTVMLNDKAIEIKDNQAKLTVNKKGKYTLSATAHDDAGNASSAEIKFTFGKQTNLLLIGIIAGILILLLLALLVVIKRRQKDQ